VTSEMAIHRRASVVVIGAGAIGLAVALQLCRAGVADVLVVDLNGSPGMGSTSRANGGVRAQFTTPINIAFSRFTIARLRELHEQTGGQVGFRAIGYLFMTGTESGEASLRTAHALQRSLGVDVDWLSPADVADRAPYVTFEGLRAATFCAGDGLIDPHGVVGALWEEARRLGAWLLPNTEVLDVTSTATGVVVHTVDGDIEGEWAVNAAGPYAAELAARSGVDLPITPRKRNLVCTEAFDGMPDVTPMCVDTDTGLLTRREGAGMLIGYSDPNDPPSFDTSFDPSFLEAIATRIGNRFAFLADVPINGRKCWAGLYPETPDHHAIVDAPEQASRFIQCAGFGGHGIMHSLAAGQAVTELITDGRCTTFDLHPLRLRRFAEPAGVAETAVL
jgi:sarcosine oxidase, subunit beta